MLKRVTDVELEGHLPSFYLNTHKWFGKLRHLSALGLPRVTLFFYLLQTVKARNKSVKLLEYFPTASMTVFSP